MYAIVELQKTDEKTIAAAVQTADTLNKAKSICHQILTYAALSSIPVHTAVILTEDGIPVMSESFTHEAAQEEE